MLMFLALVCVVITRDDFVGDRVGTASQTCNVLRNGATGGGVDDTATLQRVLDDSSCAEVVFPSGHLFAASVLWVRRSDVTLTLESNATLAGLPEAFRAQRPDCATEAGLEFKWRNWCALLRVTAAANFTTGVSNPFRSPGFRP